MITGSTRIYLKFLLFLWFTAIIMRIVFLVWQWDTISAFSWADISKAFYIGVRFDGRIAALMSLPAFIFIFTPFLSKYFDKIRFFLLILYAALFIVYILAYISDIIHYAYLQIRLNFSALELTEDTNEAAGMVWQTYPVIKLFVLLVIVTALLTFITKKIFGKWKYSENRFLAKIVSAAVTLSAVSLLIYGQYGIIYYPLRWSEAYFSVHNEITALALNPIQNLFDTRPLKNNAYADNRAEAEKAYPTAVEYLHIENPDPVSISYNRFLKGSEGTKPNVVIIVIESMSTHKSSFMFDEIDTTRFLQKLASESLYFPNYYASARTTAKAMFSIITGIPDVNTSFKTSSRDPSVVDQHVLWSDFEGYSKIYMLGGSANWANIRGVMTNNVPDIKIYEEGYWKSPRMDVWGVSDKDLLQEANDIFERQDTPFIAVVQLSSFHRPFTVPEGMADFDYSIPDKEYIEKYGFVDGEYLSMKFCDYAIEKYFETAKKSNYYDNTVFVITGDHGITEGSPSAGKNYQSLRLHEYQVPLIIHYPKAFPEGRVMKETGGHTDIFPTVAALAGIKGNNTTMGRDLLDASFGENRFTFIQRTDRPPVLINDKYCYSAEYGGSGVLYKRDSGDIADDWYPADDEDAELSLILEKINGDMLQTAVYMLHHNTKARADEALKKQSDTGG